MAKASGQLTLHFGVAARAQKIVSGTVLSNFIRLLISLDFVRRDATQDLVKRILGGFTTITIVIIITIAKVETFRQSSFIELGFSPVVAASRPAETFTRVILAVQSQGDAILRE